MQTRHCLCSHRGSLVKVCIVGNNECSLGLHEYLTFQNFFTNKTLFKNIETLPAGSILTVDLNDKFIINTFWDFDYNQVINSSNEDLVLKCEELFHSAVKSQLISDVEIGSYLSGGIDSGGITAFASKYIKNLKTFTVGFDMQSASGIEMTFDERNIRAFLRCV